MVDQMGDGSGPVARRVQVHGRVQGVFFRASTRRAAMRHGVAGWVANRDDGSVEAWLEGPEQDVQRVIAWMRAGGPPAAHVDRLDVTPQEPTGVAGFEVRR